MKNSFHLEVVPKRNTFFHLVFLFLQETNRTANENSPYSRLASGPDFFMNTTGGKSISIFLEWLKQQIRQHEIDVLLIAGDVFDSPNPSAESQRMYYRFLREVTSENPSVQIIIIAGNHDSAARLEAPNPLLENMNVTVRGVVRRNAEGDIDLQHLIVPPFTQKGGK